MTLRRSMRATILALGLVGAWGCIHRRSSFEDFLGQARWVEASDVFLADSSLRNDEDALYRAGLLYGRPGRPTYRPERADSLLRRLLARFPDTKYRNDVNDELSKLSALIEQQERLRTLEQRLAQLTAEMEALRQGLDSTVAQSDSLRRNTRRLESDLRDRDEQLRSLRLELQRLKEIDLKPVRRPPR